MASTDKTMVIRCGGNLDMANAVANTFESPKLKKLEMELGMSKQVRQRELKRKIAQANRKYAIKPMSKFHRKMLGVIGYAVLVMKGEI